MNNKYTVSAEHSATQEQLSLQTPSPKPAASKPFPQILTAEELRTLDVAGLTQQLTLAQKAIELLQEQKQDKYTSLITAQNTLLDAQKVTHRLKMNLKDLTNKTYTFNERIRILKTLIKAEHT